MDEIKTTYQAGHVSLNAEHTASQKKEDFLKSSIRSSFAVEYDESKIDIVMGNAWDACTELVKNVPAEEVAPVVVAEPVKPAEPFRSSSPKIEPTKQVDPKETTTA